MNRRRFLRIAALTPLAGLIPKSEAKPLTFKGVPLKHNPTIEPIRRKILEMKNPKLVLLGSRLHALVLAECGSNGRGVKDLRICGVPVQYSQFMGPMSGIVCESSFLGNDWVKTTEFVGRL